MPNRARRRAPAAAPEANIAGSDPSAAGSEPSMEEELPEKPQALSEEGARLALVHAHPQAPPLVGARLYTLQ